MNIVSYAQGYSLHLKGNIAWDSNPINAQRFYKMALEKFEGNNRCTPHIITKASLPFYIILFELIYNNQHTYIHIYTHSYEQQKR